MGYVDHPVPGHMLHIYTSDSNLDPAWLPFLAVAVVPCHADSERQSFEKNVSVSHAASMVYIVLIPGIRQSEHRPTEGSRVLLWSSIAFFVQLNEWMWKYN